MRPVISPSGIRSLPPFGSTPSIDGNRVVRAEAITSNVGSEVIDTASAPATLVGPRFVCHLSERADDRRAIRVINLSAVAQSRNNRAQRHPDLIIHTDSPVVLVNNRVTEPGAAGNGSVRGGRVA